MEIESGELFSWGANLCGQLGHGDLNIQVFPKKVSGLDSKVIAGDTSVFHTIVATENNTMYGWGQNNELQLGPIETITQKEPAQIPHNIEEKIVKIICGINHNLILTESGAIYSFGNNGNSQLGNTFFNRAKYKTAHQINSLNGEHIDDVIVCSTTCNLALNSKFFFFVLSTPF